MHTVGKVSSFRLLLHNISEDLVTENLKSLKYLCGDILTKAKLFINLFHDIGREDLKSKVKQFQESRIGEARDAYQSVQNDDNVAAPLHSNHGRTGAMLYHPDETFVQPGPPSWMPGTFIAEYPESHLPSAPSSLKDKPSSGMWPNTASSRMPGPSLQPHDHSQWMENSSSRSGKFPFQPDSTGKYPVPQRPAGKNPFPQQPAGKNPFLQHPAGKNPFPEHPAVSQHTAGKNPFDQDSARNYQVSQDSNGSYPFPMNSTGKYHSQGSVPFGQQVTEEVEHLKDEFELVNLSESAKKPDEVSVSRHSPTNDHTYQETKAPNEVLESRDQPDKGSPNIPPGRPTVTSCITASTSSAENLSYMYVEPQEKVPVERCMSTDFSDANSQCFHQKCPVEMSYDCIKNYFQNGAKELGKGGFGVVYEGTCKFHGQDVVVKEENSVHRGQAYSVAQLKREKRVGYIKHPHLMPLYAFSAEKGNPCCLMYPKMHSDLHKALRKDSSGRQKLPWETRARIALHTARALQYLHKEVTNERNVRQEVVHMDVKPGNIFLDEDFNARLGDPGMSQELSMGHSFVSISQTRGTEGYVDVYLQLPGRRFRPINDIFSFGVVMLELLTQRKAVEVTWPNKNMTLHHVLDREGVLSEPEKLMGKAKKGVWPDSGDGENYTKEFASIAIDCLKPPDERVGLPDICKRLEGVLKRRGVAKASKPKDGARCMSCLLNHPAKYLPVRSSSCDGDHIHKCNYFCVTCLTQARRNPLECPSHGPAEPLIGGSDTYAVLICGNDPEPKIAAVFERDLIGFKDVLTDSRIVGVRRDHIYCIKPPLSSDDIQQAAKVVESLQKLKQDLDLQGKKDVFLYFYFSGHSDQNGNLMCSSEKDVVTDSMLREHLHCLKDNVGEFLIILDCCYADGKNASEDLKDDAYLVHKSPGAAEEMEPPQQFALESLCSYLNDAKEPISSAAEQCTETGYDTSDGSVFCKAPLNAGFTVRQWSSSLSRQKSYGKPKGSFLTQYIICGLRGAHSCPFAKTICPYCETFKVQAKSLGYITAANLEVFVSMHVELAAFKVGMRQSPRMRTLHSNETKLAYYSEEVLRDEVMFRSTYGGIKRIAVEEFPLTLVQFQMQLFNKVKGHVPNCAQPKHLQILCDDEEIVPDSYVDLADFLRQGYDIMCQLRPCCSIISGPVMLEIQNNRELQMVINLLTFLQLTTSQDMNKFEVDTTQKSFAAEDLNECFEENPSLSDLKDTPLGNSLTMILLTVSTYPGHLTITVLDNILDCSFKATKNPRLS